MRTEEQPASSSRRPDRRELILEMAAGLFHQHGYDATGIDEIGEAAGITGPGVYRHFESKEAILETLVRERGAAVLDEVRRIVAETTDDPRATLDGLIDNYVTTLLANMAVSVIGVYERRTLGPETRAWVERSERLLVEEWVHALSQLRPELGDAEAHLVVHAALNMALAVGNYRSGLDEATLVPLLKSMLHAAVDPADDLPAPPSG